MTPPPLKEVIFAKRQHSVDKRRGLLQMKRREREGKRTERTQ